MDEQQELLDEGFQVRDLRTGVAKVYQEAKRRSTLGIRVTAGWAVVLLIFAIVDLVGVAVVAPPLWDLGLGLTAILLSALAMSRAPSPLLGASLGVIVDIAVVAYRFPELIEHGDPSDQVAAGLRIALSPVVLFFVLGGYFGSLSIQAFKMGFSPGADWRTRMNPVMMQLVVVGSCVGAIGLGVAVWFGAVASGFARTDVVWATRGALGSKTAHVKTSAATEVATAKDDRTDGGLFAEFDILNRKPKGEPEGPPKYPENAIPIETTKGLDAFAKREVEDAYEFGKETDEAGCVLESHGRQDRCRDDRCRYWSRVFARACLAKSRKTEHFCDAVPEPMLAEAGTSWADKMCAGRNMETCREILYAVQGHCHPPTPQQLAEVKGEKTPVSPGSPPPEK